MPDQALSKSSSARESSVKIGPYLPDEIPAALVTNVLFLGLSGAISYHFMGYSSPDSALIFHTNTGTDVMLPTRIGFKISYHCL